MIGIRNEDGDDVVVVVSCWWDLWGHGSLSLLCKLNGRFIF